MLTPQKDAPPGFPFSEKKARGHLGVTRDEMRALRNRLLTEGTHYIRGKQQAVWLNDAGVAALTAAQCPDAPTAGEHAGDPNALESTPVKSALINILRQRVEQLQKNGAPTAPTDATTKLLVVNCQLKNPRMLIACALDDDPFRPVRTVRVRVNSTANFTRRMEIPVQLVAGYTDLFELTRKCPRQKGKW